MGGVKVVKPGKYQLAKEDYIPLRSNHSPRKIPTTRKRRRADEDNGNLPEKIHKSKDNSEGEMPDSTFGLEMPDDAFESFLDVPPIIIAPIVQPSKQQPLLEKEANSEEATVGSLGNPIFIGDDDDNVELPTIADLVQYGKICHSPSATETTKGTENDKSTSHYIPQTVDSGYSAVKAKPYVPQVETISPALSAPTGNPMYTPSVASAAQQHRQQSLQGSPQFANPFWSPDVAALWAGQQTSTASLPSPATYQMTQSAPQNSAASMPSPATYRRTQSAASMPSPPTYPMMPSTTQNSATSMPSPATYQTALKKAIAGYGCVKPKPFVPPYVPQVETISPAVSPAPYPPKDFQPTLQAGYGMAPQMQPQMQPQYYPSCPGSENNGVLMQPPARSYANPTATQQTTSLYSNCWPPTSLTQAEDWLFRMANMDPKTVESLSQSSRLTAVEKERLMAIMPILFKLKRQLNRGLA